MKKKVSKKTIRLLAQVIQSAKLQAMTAAEGPGQEEVTSFTIGKVKDQMAELLKTQHPRFSVERFFHAVEGRLGDASILEPKPKKTKKTKTERWPNGQKVKFIPPREPSPQQRAEQVPQTNS